MTLPLSFPIELWLWELNLFSSFMKVTFRMVEEVWRNLAWLREKTYWQEVIEYWVLVDKKWTHVTYTSGYLGTDRIMMSFPDGSVDKDFICIAEDTGNVGSIFGLERSPGGGKWQPTLVFLPEKVSWTEELDRLRTKGSQRVRHNWMTKNTCTQDNEGSGSLLGVQGVNCLFLGSLQAK